MGAGAKVFNGLASFGRTTATIKAYAGFAGAALMVLSALYCIFFAKPTTATDAKTGKTTQVKGGMIGLVLLAMAVFIALVSWFNMYMVKQSKVYAAASGAGTGMDLASGLLSRVWGKND
jgi:hypothetical protein